MSPAMSEQDDQQLVLRELAGRVGRQMEEFAEKLDSFRPGNEPGDSRSHQAAQKLVRDFQRIAYGMYEEARKEHEAKTVPAMDSNQPSARSSIETDDRAPARVTSYGLPDDVRRWQSESQTWELIADLLIVQDPEEQRKASEAAQQTMQNLHRYSTDRDFWDQFVLQDNIAQERITVLKWLHNTAETSRPPIEELARSFENEAERGEGLIAQPWLYTKEAIKMEKRLRSVQRPLKPSDEGIDSFRSKSGDKRRLVLELDPDAPSRLELQLEKQDVSFDQATWLACYEMLRRGKTWKEMEEWCSERQERWRALSLRGASGVKSDGECVDDAFSRMACYSKHRVWQSMCSTAAARTRDHEAAVYSILSGGSVIDEALCQTVEDHLFLQYNAELLRRYQAFIKERRTVNTAAERYDFIRKYVRDLQTRDTRRVEIYEPCKWLQLSILAWTHKELFQTFGTALGKLYNKNENSDLVVECSNIELPQNTEDPLYAAVDNPDALRMAAHYLIVRLALTRQTEEGGRQTAQENIIVAYIQYLKQNRKMDLIPLYASHLSESRRLNVLAKVLVDVTDHNERRTLAILMRQLNMDLPKIFAYQYGIYSSIVWNSFKPKRTEILYDGWRDPYRKVRDVRDMFIGTNIHVDDENLIRALEWHFHLDGNWGMTCEALSETYRFFLRKSTFLMVPLIQVTDFSKALDILRLLVNCINGCLSRRCR